MAARRVKTVTALVVVLLYAIALLLVLTICSSPPREEAPPEVIQEEPFATLPPAEEPPIVDLVVEEEPLVEDVVIPIVEEEPISKIEEEPPVEEEIVPIIVPIVVEEPPFEEEVQVLPPPEEEFYSPWDDWEEPFDDFMWADDDEYDIWADFFVAGEEDYALFFDGTYYVPLFVNDEYLGDLSVTFGDEDIFINVGELKKLVGSLLVADVRDELFGEVGEELPLEELNAKGVDAWFDYNLFELYLTFSTEMMPIRTLSLNPGRLLKYSTYSMGGSEFIEPTKFSWYSNYSIYSLLSLSEHNDWKISPTSLFTMQSHNSISLFNVAFDFSYSFHPGQAYREYLSDKWSTEISDYLSFYGIQGFYDFQSKSLRLTFGNVNDYLGLSRDTIGIALEKRYSYGDVKAKGHQMEYLVEFDEPSTVEVFINEKSVYRRQLQAGIYNLKDFSFTQGANRVRVEVTPLSDEDATREYEFDLGYDSRLLSQGDTLYTLSLSMPQIDPTRTTFRAEQHIGLTHTISASYNLRASPSAIYLGLNTIIATTFGTFDVLGGASYSKPYAFGYFGQLGYRVGLSDDSILNSFDLTLGYRNARYNEQVNISPSSTVSLGDDRLNFSLSLSGKLPLSINYSFSGSLEWRVGEPGIDWRASLNLGLHIIPKLPISGSISISQGSDDAKATIRGQMSLSYSFTPSLSASTSTNFQSWPSFNANWRILNTQRSNLNFSLSSFHFEDPLQHQGSLSYSYSGSAFGLSVRQQYSDGFKRFNTSLSLNTALAFANGMLGITRSIGENFLLVKPTGALKGSDIAVTKTMTTAPDPLPKIFGVGLFSGISSNIENNVVIYGVGESAMSSGASFVYDFIPRPRQGYAIRISSEMTHAVVGTLLHTANSAYSRYATNLYKVEYDEEGWEILVPDESLYIFTDESGFFYLDGVAKGEYQFSLYLPKSSEDDPPIDIRINIEPERDDKATVFVIETFIADEFSQRLDFENFDRMMGIEVEDPLIDDEGHFHIPIIDTMDEETFWDVYYPSRAIIASYHEEIELSGDSIVERLPSEKFSGSAFNRMSTEEQQRYINMMRLNSILKPYIDAILPQRGAQESVVAP